MLICIDAGHGGSDPGAVNGSYQEKTAALEIAKKIGNALAQTGASIIYTRTTDKTVELEQRTSFANAKGADYFLSVHLNSATAKSANGIETYAYGNTGDMYKLAQAVQQELIAATGAVDRGVKTANFYVLRKTKMTAILIETGFISNNSEAAKLFQASYQDTIAAAVARAVANFAGLELNDEMKRYNYLKEIPAGEFRSIIKTLMEKGLIKNKDGQLDLSYDMIRMFVINYRAGIYGA